MISNPVPWPDGARCAACVTFDIDAESLIHIEHPDDGYKRASALSMLQYGPTVAIPRIVETYRRLGIRQTFFVPAWCIERYPQAIDTILAGGHEIAQHGFLHENPVTQSAAEQAYWIDRAGDVIRRATGRSPRGYRAPLYNFTDQTAGLLVERGFAYDSSLMADDVPYLVKAAGGDFVELPTHWGVDDWPQYVQSMDLDYMMPIRSPSHGFQIFREEFEVAHRYGGLWIPVVHPFATGRLARWHVFAEFLAEVIARGDVWFASMEEIAAHVRAVVADGRHVPREMAMPQYDGPVRLRSPDFP